jgi:hypothetical protein
VLSQQEGHMTCFTADKYESLLVMRLTLTVRVLSSLFQDNFCTKNAFENVLSKHPGTVYLLIVTLDQKPSFKYLAFERAIFQGLF